MPTEVDEMLSDGAAAIHMLKPTKDIKLFDDYATKLFIPYVKRQLASVSRLDMIWDRYIQNSLEETTPGNRGSGVRTKVTVNGRLPKN